MQPPPTPSVEPLFASDEEALAAAEEAYAAYLAMSDEIAGDGGADPERIAPFVTTERLRDELDSVRRLLARTGFTQSGATTFDPLTASSSVDDGAARSSFYACWDASAGPSP